jgi:hypothetical protein
MASRGVYETLTLALSHGNAGEGVFQVEDDLGRHPAKTVPGDMFSVPGSDLQQDVVRVTQINRSSLP